MDARQLEGASPPLTPRPEPTGARFLVAALPRRKPRHFVGSCPIAFNESYEFNESNESNEFNECIPLARSIRLRLCQSPLRPSVQTCVNFYWTVIEYDVVFGVYPRHPYRYVRRHYVRRSSQ